MNYDFMVCNREDCAKKKDLLALPQVQADGWAI